MPVAVIMPKVDMDMASGKVMDWYVKEGGWVEKGAPIFEIETDKAAMEVEAEASGFLHFRVSEGEDIPIGAPVGWLFDKGEAVAAPADVKAPEPPEEEEQSAGDAPTPEVTPLATASESLRATPNSRRIAHENGIDLATVPGSGPRGRVQADDVAALLEVPAPAPAMPATFDAETGPLAVTRSEGGTGDPVLLLHGFASDSMSWRPLEATLAHKPLIRVDLPGHGKSPKRRVPDFAALVSMIRETFDSLALDRAHLVGHSLGGALALALADTRPAKVASLTLIAPAGLGPELNADILMGIAKSTRVESLSPWLKQLVHDERLITDSYARLAMAGRQDPTLRAAQHAYAEAVFPDGVQAFDLRAALGRVTATTKIVWGRQDQVIPWRHALHAQGSMALHLFDRVGHMPQLEAPEAVGKLIAECIDTR